MLVRRVPSPGSRNVATRVTWCAPLVFLFLFLPRGIAASTPATPGPRWGSVFVHDPVRNVVVLFGGASQRHTYHGDTWILEGDTWLRHDVPGPEARGFSAASFHRGRGTIVMHGGRGEERKTYSDTWEWDGSAWRRLEEQSDFVSDHHQMVYDPEREWLIAFGGWDGEGVTGATWVWDGSWRRLRVADGPPPRAAFAMAYDAQRRRVVLNGGLWGQGQYADIWEWDGTTWSASSGPYDNVSLDHHAMIYDARARRVIAFGGKNYRYQALGSTSTISGGRLESIASEGPSPRYSVNMTYDSSGERVVLYGGKKLQGREQMALGDLWIWQDDVWQRLSTDSEHAEAVPGDPAPRASTHEDAEEQLRAAFQAFSDAFRDGNVDVLQRMITSNYMHSNGGSPLIDRETWLEYNRGRSRQLQAGTLIVDEYETHELVVEMLTLESAVVSGLHVNRGRRNGEPYESIVRSTQTWVFHDGRWKRAAFHDTRQ